ncbi:uncharacterized protein KQ657_000025 [Scheffersomyces spartinae]|uniref:NAD(P)H-hydrate epimerase n=1 Tax=Scheffersomyces spartinae TaxID=45513 RepID=A0A9P7VDA6_9ASCO|nr:uncharacterized protein KQ657_000025 [Scheffersomyces spartinae]KAG7196018.1 hypothetical protein KQ657_000025 [Scheffersomyces spartinae]
MWTALSAKAAAQLDRELMSTGAFSIDQLMELAGLAVAKAIYKQYPPVAGNKNDVVFLIGPGNNGGDGLVAARHLKLWGGYEPILYYPKRVTSNQLYTNLLVQLQDLKISQIGESEIKTVLNLESTKLIVDALFGFSFKPPIRPPFNELIEFLSTNKSTLSPIVSVDIPSGWDVDNGPVGDHVIVPDTLVSLTAPKPCAKFLGEKPHYLGGRFINENIAEKYQIEDLIKLYKNDDLIVKL